MLIHTTAKNREKLQKTTALVFSGKMRVFPNTGICGIKNRTFSKLNFFRTKLFCNLPQIPKSTKALILTFNFSIAFPGNLSQTVQII